jgi:hypothetical protein
MTHGVKGEEVVLPDLELVPAKAKEVNRGTVYAGKNLRNSICGEKICEI